MLSCGVPPLPLLSADRTLDRAESTVVKRLLATLAYTTTTTTANTNH